MAVVTQKSTAVANGDAKPIAFNFPFIERGKLHQNIGYAAVASGDSILSQYRLARVRGGDRLATISIFCSAITSAAADIGFYETLANGGGPANATAGNTSLIASAQSLASALNGVNVTYSKVALTNMEKRLWELLGYTSDPGKDFDLTLTLSAAATAAGTVGLHYTGNSGE